MRASEFITETWPVAVAKWFDILRKSQKFKHLPDDKIQQMATRAAQKEVAPAQKAATPKQSMKDRFNQHRQEMSDEEFQDYYGFGKWDESVIENFADGKVKGKSRPGRVKKAGASCKGSVSHLRKMAKKYGGEKGKMYHWCANMKAGKKK
jgi:hypothetical protein